MAAFDQYGAALITSTEATALGTSLTSAVTDNIGAVLVVVGVVVGIGFGRSMINKALKKGKV